MDFRIKFLKSKIRDLIEVTLANLEMAHDSNFFSLSIVPRTLVLA